MKIEKIVLLALAFSLALIPVYAQLTDDTFSTWSMDAYAWDGKPLPTLGLANSTHPLSLTYNLHETGLPAKVDWRKTPYGTRVTSVQDQDGCGACVAYAITGQIESAIEIAQNSTNPRPDLAEMEFFKGSCQSGWIFERAYPVAISPGLMTQSCYDSGTCKDRVTIASWTTTKSPKEALQNGPIVTGCDWDTPWFYYDGGIINEYTGDVAGGHALCVVGYDDSQNCWIVKNSWGTGWGESGFFRIDYTTAAEAGFGTSYPWYTITVKGSPGPVPPGPVPPTPEQNKTFTAKQISSYYGTTGAYKIGTTFPDKKYILTTIKSKGAYPTGTIGSYPASQGFGFYLTTSTGKTFYTDPKKNSDKAKHATIFNLTNGKTWISWTGIASRYSVDGMIEVSHN